MRSLPPAAYAALPALTPPAGYICVMRDVDSDGYRIQATSCPVALVHDALEEAAGDFGIELLSILETEDLAASESELYEAYHAELSETWLALDPYQLQELRRSALRIDDHASHYLAANRVSSSLAPVTDRRREQAAVSSSRRRFGAFSEPSRRMKPGPAAYKRYGTRALLRERRRDIQRQAGHEPASWRQSLSEGFDNLMQNRPGLFIALVLLAMLLFLIFAWRNPHLYPYRY